MREMSVSTTLLVSSAPIGPTKVATRKTRSGSVSAIARSLTERCVRASPRASPRSSSIAAAAAVIERKKCDFERKKMPDRARSRRSETRPLTLLRHPGVEALVELVQILEPELVVYGQRRL